MKVSVPLVVCTVSAPSGKTAAVASKTDPSKATARNEAGMTDPLDAKKQVSGTGVFPEQALVILHLLQGSSLMTINAGQSCCCEAGFLISLRIQSSDKSPCTFSTPRQRCFNCHGPLRRQPWGSPRMRCRAKARPKRPATPRPRHPPAHHRNLRQRHRPKTSLPPQSNFPRINPRRNSQRRRDPRRP